jgi:acetyl-CoA carboxylase biotin carboxylase subunit
MVAKLIVHRKTREDALRTMVRALGEFRLDGVKTTIPLHLQILASRRFAEGAVDTTYVEQNLLK